MGRDRTGTERSRTGMGRARTGMGREPTPVASWRVMAAAVMAAAVIAAVTLGGCGLGVTLPARSETAGGSQSSTTTTVARGRTRAPAEPRVRTNEVPTPPGPDERAPAAASPTAALAHFADLYINWNARDVKHRLTTLAGECVGQARSAMQLAAAQTGADPELAQAGIANRGTVEAVAPLAGSGSGSRYVVITREMTSATESSAYQGLAAAWHLTVATVTRRGAGWVISGWQPES